MRRAPTLSIPFSRARERQVAPRSVLPPLATVAEADYAPSGEAVKRNLAVIGRPSGSLDFPTLLIDRHAYDLVHGRWRLGVLGRAEAEVIQ